MCHGSLHPVTFPVQKAENLIHGSLDATDWPRVGDRGLLCVIISISGVNSA